MASKHDKPTSVIHKLSSLQPSSSLPSFPGPPRPHSRTNSGRSTALRSAEEQLRYIREGDTSWQRQHPDSSNESPSSPTTSSSSTAVAMNGDDQTKTEQTIRVYLHHVRKTDTMPLILLAYKISATMLKKANRLWSTDSIQSREKLYLPVDDCGVKAQSCPYPPKSNITSKEDKQIGLDERTNAHGDNGEWPPRLRDQ